MSRLTCSLPLLLFPVGIILYWNAGSLPLNSENMMRKFDWQIEIFYKWTDPPNIVEALKIANGILPSIF